MRSDESKDLRVAYRLLREISVWADLRHQNILPLIGFYLSPTLDIALLVNPLEPLGSVKDFLKTHVINIRGRMELVAQVGRGIAYLHTLDPPVTHRDIKAANILVNRQGEAMLCDFGLAKSKFRSGLETLNTFAGSVPFCSPELFHDVDRSPASDMWAMGCLVVEIVLGVMPFAPITNPAAIMNKIIIDKQLPSSKEALKPPHDLWDVVAHCWHFERDDRIHATEFLRYWDLKTQNHPALTTEKPMCPRKVCEDRRQRLGVQEILKRAGALMAASSVSAALQWMFKVPHIVRLRSHDRNHGRALLALDALPRARLAGWSANRARASCFEGTHTAVLKDIRA
ncbi:hypothetical protein FRB95_012192 [Tulasnella sp. JGI-2019a]|nr:hypothetical protein FRB95_012192 [Tulasnella sp. JGI-2019a]